MSSAGICEMVGLGRAVVLQPSLPREILLNPDVPDSKAFATSHQVQQSSRSYHIVMEADYFAFFDMLSDQGSVDGQIYASVSNRYGIALEILLLQ